jgi:benzoyl-CoA reductase subunit B
MTAASPGPRVPAEAGKERSMSLQKQMIAGHYSALARAPQEGRKVVYTFVPGNLTELLRSFDLLPVLPEINALQSGMRKLSGDYIAEAEKHGHSEDVCTYVKCDIGMLKSGNVGPTGVVLPSPDLLLLSYTGCFTFLKWFELLRQEYQCPVAMLHVPYLANGRIEPHHVDYVVQQLRTEVIPKREQVSGRRYDEARLAEMLALSAQAEGADSPASLRPSGCLWKFGTKLRQDALRQATARKTGLH